MLNLPLMLANLLPDASLEFDQFVLPIVQMRKRQEGVPICGINMPQHRAPQMLDVVRLEQRVPPRHPLIVRRVEYRHAVPRPVGRLPVRHLARLGVLQGDIPSVAAEPLVPAMLFIREEGRRRGFAQAGGHGEAAGATTDDYNVEDLVVDIVMWRAVHLGWGGRLDPVRNLLFLHLKGVDLVWGWGTLGARCSRTPGMTKDERGYNKPL